MKSMLGIVLLSVCLLISSCATAPAQAPTATPAPVATIAPTVAPTVVPTAAAPASVTDSAGRVVPIPANVTKIISLAPSTTEIIFALGKGSQLVAIDMYSDYPLKSAKLPKYRIPI